MPNLPNTRVAQATTSSAEQDVYRDYEAALRADLINVIVAAKVPVSHKRKRVFSGVGECTTLEQALIAAELLRQSINEHITNTFDVHLIPSSELIITGIAVDQVSADSSISQLILAYNNHRTEVAVHTKNDTSNIATDSTNGSLEELLASIASLDSSFQAHTNSGMNCGAVSGTSIVDPTPTPPPDVVERMFTIVVIPDSQQLTTTSGGRAIITAYHNWIVANKDALNIRHVFATGDLVTNQDEVQFTFLQAEFAKIKAAGIPWNYTAGNHDMGSGRIYTPLNTFFPLSNFTDMPNYVGGYTADSHSNQTYFEFTEGSRTILLCGSEFYPMPAHVAHLNAFVAARVALKPNLRSIIGIHALLNCILGSPTAVIQHNETGDMNNYSQGTGGYRCVEFNNEVILYHPSVRLALCGHRGNTTEGGRRLVQTGLNNNTVNALLQNYQYISARTGQLRLLTFNIDGTVSVTTYSPSSDVYYHQAEEEFTIANADFWV